MDYKTILIVTLLLGLPTIVLVIAKLIAMVRKRWFDRGDRLSDEEGQSVNEHGKEGTGSVASALSTTAVYDYLEDAVLCYDPAGKESFDEVKDKKDS